MVLCTIKLIAVPTKSSSLKNNAKKHTTQKSKLQTQQISPLQITAYHEAAHAVVDVLKYSFYCIQYATIQHFENKDGHVLNKSTYLESNVLAFDVERYIQACNDLCMADLAGGVGEQICRN